jgi:hypothetical protein
MNGIEKWEKEEKILPTIASRPLGPTLTSQLYKSVTASTSSSNAVNNSGGGGGGAEGGDEEYNHVIPSSSSSFVGAGGGAGGGGNYPRVIYAINEASASGTLK